MTASDGGKAPRRQKMEILSSVSMVREITSAMVRGVSLLTIARTAMKPVNPSLKERVTWIVLQCGSEKNPLPKLCCSSCCNEKTWWKVTHRSSHPPRNAPIAVMSGPRTRSRHGLSTTGVTAPPARLELAGICFRHQLPMSMYSALHTIE